MAAASERNVLVLYGSETGNAQDMAEELGQLCQRLRFQTCVQGLDAVELGNLLDHRLVVFVVSTAGQGDLPHNALLFWRKLLRKKLPPGCLSQLTFTCFGLGDSSYVNFNWAARKLVRRLLQLGASTFMEPSEADEQFPEGIDGSFVRWAEALRLHLLEHYPDPSGLPPIADDVNLPPRWSLEPALRKLEADGSCGGHVGPDGSVDEPPVAGAPPSDLVPIPGGWTATLADSKRMTPDAHWQDVRLLSLDIASRGPGQRLDCNPGDCLTIYPRNFPEDAQRVIALMGWGSVADEPLDLELCGPLPRDLHAPSPCTLRGLLLHSIDFAAVPRRSFLRSISHYSSNEDHRERLVELTKAEFLDEYFDYATRSRRTIIEVLEDFPSVRIPAERVLDVFPLIRGRDFSVANGGASLAHPTGGDATRVELLVAMVRYRTILRKPREGLCSRYLASLGVGAVLGVGHRAALSPMHGAANARRPLVAMATGTGIAPVRSLLHERLTHASRAPAVVFFGNRNRAADFFFADEWAALPADAVVVLTAFSRDQRDKVYVQDVVRREAPRLAAVLARRPIVAVCGGSSKMADACKRAVLEPLVGDGGGEREREAWLRAMTWWQEIW